MSKTRFFLSSTCYDLRALREHLREKIEDMGHELLASEYPSFPVSPDLSTIENCKKVVREQADLLILVVGGRRGSLDVTGTRSVVNAEYLEARSRGIDSFVFVDKQIWDLLPVYQKNPQADFTPIVDYPDVFEFVAELKADSRWIYTFTRTEEIISVLKTQLSVYLKMLIERGRVGSLIVPREFASESRKVIALIQERPRFWEHLLTCELLEQAVSNGRQRLRELNEGLVFRPVELIPEDNTIPRVRKFVSDIVNLASLLDPALRRIPPSWGPVGVSGDPIEIQRACHRIATLINGLVDWETELRFIKVDDKYTALFSALHGSTLEILDELSKVAPAIRNGIRHVENNPGPHSLSINLVVKSPSTLEQFQKELKKLEGGFSLW